jgi:hypothetical protein
MRPGGVGKEAAAMPANEGAAAYFSVWMAVANNAMATMSPIHANFDPAPAIPCLLLSGTLS